MNHQTFLLSGTATDAQLQELAAFLRRIGLQAPLQTTPVFSSWLETLPGRDIDGFHDEAVNWIRLWGSGGGDASTESIIMSAPPSNNPVVWAEAAHDSISGYSKTEFEATQLIGELVDDVLRGLA